MSCANSTKQTKQPQQRKDSSYHKLVRDVILNNGGPEAGPWRIRMEETPEPGVQNMLSRGVVERPAEKADLDRLKSSEWYQFKQQYTQIGNRSIQGNVIIRVVRFYMPAQPNMIDPIDAAPHTVNDLKLLDQSGSCVVEAIVRVETLWNSTITDKAKQELSAFHSYMDGAITLYAPDRLALDTRVKGKA